MTTRAQFDALTQTLEKPQLQDLLWDAFTLLSYPRQNSMEARIKKCVVEHGPKGDSAAAMKQRLKETPAGEDPKEYAFRLAETQTRSFIEHAWKRAYVQDAGFSGVISREDYLHWDKPVRACLKAIRAIGPESPSFQSAVDLQIDLYEVLCFASVYKLLRKKQPFHFLNTRQDTFFQELLDRIMQAFPREAAIRRMVKAASFRGPDLEETDLIFLVQILIRSLKTDENRRLAMEEARRLAAANESKPKSYLPYCQSEEKDRYFQYRHQIDLLQLTDMLECSLSREALERHVRENLSEQEDPAYHLGQFLFHTKDDAVWKLVYEIGLSMGIQTKEADKLKYERLTAGT